MLFHMNKLLKLPKAPIYYKKKQTKVGLHSKHIYIIRLKYKTSIG